MLGNGIVIFVMLMIGKIFGFVREIIFSYMFGTGLIADAYFTASIIPNLLNTPLTISSLVFFIPIYNRIQVQKKDNNASEFTSNIITIYCLFNLVVTIFAIVAAPVLIKIIAPGINSETSHLAITLTKLLSLSFPFSVIAAILINLSNANQKHILPQFLTSMNNVMVVIAMIFLIPVFGIYCVPVIGVFCWIIQIVIQYFSCKGYYKYRPTLNFKDPNLRKIIYLAIPVVIATAADQINLTVDNGLASLLDSGSISILNYGQKLFNIINGTVSMVIITLTYPILSKLFAKNNVIEMKKNFDYYINVIVAVLVPIIIISIVCRFDITKIVYGRGSFSSSSIDDTSIVFFGYIIGCVFSAVKEYTTRAFYVIDDSLTPTVLNIVCVILNVIFNLVLINIFGLLGLALSTSIATMFAAIIGIYLYNRKIKKLSSNGYVKNIYYIRHFIISGSISLIFVYLIHVFSNLQGILACIVYSITVFSCYFIILIVLQNPIAITIKIKIQGVYNKHVGKIV